MISKIYLWYTLSSNLWLFKGNSAKCGSILFVLQRTAVERNSGDSEKNLVFRKFLFIFYFSFCALVSWKKKKKSLFFLKENISSEARYLLLYVSKYNQQRDWRCVPSRRMYKEHTWTLPHIHICIHIHIHSIWCHGCMGLPIHVRIQLLYSCNE